MAGVKESTVALDEVNDSPRKTSTRSKWIIGVLSVIVVGLAVGLGITLANQGGEEVPCDIATAVSAGYEAAAGPSYHLRQEFAGESFFDDFDFQTSDQFYAKFNDGRPDPTWGYVNYVNKSVATDYKLFGITPEGRARMDVEHNEIAEGYGRKTLRIRSKKTWRTGLFIADVEHMPQGRATWPALWTVDEPNWPKQGEIDLIEGCNDMAFTQATLHTGPTCDQESVQSPAHMSGPGFIYPNCNTELGCTGCGVQGPFGSFGPHFNQAGGGTFMLEWTDEFLKTWFFARGASPLEKDPAQRDNPTPWAWGKPFAYWDLSEKVCSSKTNFGAHNLIINTCLCGDWGGRFWHDECAAYVRDNPKAFEQAFWEINFVRIYQTGETQTPEQTSNDYPRGV